MDWDLSSYFNNFNGPTYKAFKSELAETIEELTKRAEHLLSESDLDIGHWEALIIDYEHLHASVSHLGSYIGCLTSAEANNEDYLKEEVGFSNTQASLSKLADKLIRGIGLMDEEAFEDLLSRERLQDAGFILK